MSQKYGSRANGAAPPDRSPCLVCDAERPSFSWTDAHGEGYCTRCGTPYQLIIDGVRGGVPRCNIAEEHIPLLREFWTETNSTNGMGTFATATDYADQIAGRRRFNKWYADREAAAS